jgi:hypothetical protein
MSKKNKAKSNAQGKGQAKEEDKGCRHQSNDPCDLCKSGVTYKIVEAGVKSRNTWDISDWNTTSEGLTYEEAVVNARKYLDSSYADDGDAIYIVDETTDVVVSAWSMAIVFQDFAADRVFINDWIGERENVA